MREAAFVKQNKDKWLEFETILTNKTQIDPDLLSDLYIEITDHLSYAKTFYSNSNTERYLNQLASKAHQNIYRTKKESKNRLISFFKTEFPTMFYQHHRLLKVMAIETTEKPVDFVANVIKDYNYYTQNM